VSSFEDEIVFLVEGEKDADALAALGYVATTKSGGSGGWKPELTKWFKGKNVFVVPDNDEAGRKTARNSASALAGIAGSVKVADICEGMAPRSDISDWLAVHNTAELEELLQKAPAFSTEEIVNITDLFFTIDAGDMDAVISADDFVEDLLIAGQMSVVYGPSGSGKTFFASDLALHVAHGRAWRGREVTQGGVLYIAAEGAYGIRNRIVAFQKRFGGDPPPLAVLPSNVNFFDSEEDISRLLSTIEAKAEEFGGVSLVVVDTLARVLAGGNENSSEDMGALIRNSDRVRQTAGAHVMLIHHTGKDEARGARGHSSLRAATDTEIEISMSDLGATARVTKQRELEMSGEFGFELDTVELGIGPRGKPITSCVVRAIEFTAPKKMRRPRYPNQKVIWKVVRKMKKDKALFPLPLPLQGYGIMMDDLFEKCRSQFLCDERHRRERFEKALEGLIGDDFVDHNEGWIWLK
jgi:5S rRNA maturation endonuclease (ribonuclease M5)